MPAGKTLADIEIEDSRNLVFQIKAKSMLKYGYQPIAASTKIKVPACSPKLAACHCSIYFPS